MKVLSRVVIAAAVVAFALSAAAVGAATAPSAPRNLKATALDQQVTLSWSAPTTGAPIDYYQVITSPGNTRANPPSSPYSTPPDLTNGTLYSFAVRAHNAQGYGPAARITATPHATPPGPPTGLAATPGPSDGQYTLTWSPPTSAGSSPSGSPPATINHYTVKISPSATCTFIDPNASCIASNIPDNLSSAFSVTATNSRNVTGPAATVYAPLPSSATIGLQPTAGLLSASITATGQNFLANEAITLYWDVSSHVAASVVTDSTGGFTKTVKPFQTDKPKLHKLCASVPPKPCANFSLQAPPTPIATLPSASPDQSPSPSAGPSQASGARSGGGGGNGLEFITKPPFVFLPIIAILGLLALLAYWALSSRRRPVAPTSATVVHRATRPDYMAPFPTAAQPPPVPPAVAPPAPTLPPAVQPPPVRPVAPPAQPLPPPVQPAQPAQPPVQWPTAPPPAARPTTPSPPPPPPTWPATPDEPPDLPEPSD